MSEPALTFTMLATEQGPAFKICTTEDPVPPLIALAFGRALQAASEVFLVPGTVEDPEPDHLPAYPRSAKVL